MNEKWESFLENINCEIERLDADGCQHAIFRGHNDKNWKLLPSLFREVPNRSQIPTIETNLYTDFKLNSGPIYGKKLTSWEIIFEMRQSGIPTRLLDWTENFGSALFFALKGVDWNKNSISKKPITPCVWILDPHELNKKFSVEDTVYLADEFQFDLYDIIFENKKRVKSMKISGPIAILPPRVHQRSFAQKSVYTLHVLNNQPLEKICKSCVKKFEIPLDSIDNAFKFLKLAGINEYSLFPDLDSLGRLISSRFKDH